MIIKEVPITWRHAVQYGNEAKEKSWISDRGLKVNQSNTCTLLPLHPNMDIPEIRDWVFMAVGHEYQITAIFKDEKQSGSIRLPHLFRFKFEEIEIAMLFKLTWF